METKQITLIASSHDELGELNSNELYKILQKIKPEIIFEEIFFTRSRENEFIYDIENTVETIAINKYINRHKVKHVPVDFDYSFIINDIKFLYNKLDSINDTKYKENNKKKSYLMGKYGFKCLNSCDFESVIDELKDIEKRLIIELNDVELMNIFESWEKINDKRGDEMVKNIYQYSKKSDYNDAVFIFGVAHKKSIHQKIMYYNDKYQIKVNWKLYGYENCCIRANGI